MKIERAAQPLALSKNINRQSKQVDFTEANIRSLAPDPGTADRAREVAHARRWLRLEGNERAVWGELGDPANPYRTQVDLLAPAFRCTCPVRRLPCKHGIALLLLFAKNNDAFSLAEPPGWVTEWLTKRDERAAALTKPSEETERQRSPEAENVLAEKRRQNREKRMAQMFAGLAELESWLADLFRQGLATLEGQADDYWQALSARMVDAKLTTLARRIRRLPSLAVQGSIPRHPKEGNSGSANSHFRGAGVGDWHQKLLDELGDIYLLAKGFQRLEQLPEGLQDDLLSLAGVNFKKEDLLTLNALEDHWLVAGQTETAEEGNLYARRTWLIGEKTRRTCLYLEFAWADNPYEMNWRLGGVLAGEVVFYPSALPLRVLFKKYEWVEKSFQISSGYADLEDFADACAAALAANPWLSNFPAFLQNVVPVFDKNRFVLVDKARKMLPLYVEEIAGWKLVAMSGGLPLDVFGQWNGEWFHPMSLVVGGGFRLLQHLEPMARKPASNYEYTELPF